MLRRAPLSAIKFPWRSIDKPHGDGQMINRFGKPKAMLDLKIPTVFRIEARHSFPQTRGRARKAEQRQRYVDVDDMGETSYLHRSREQ